LPACKGTPPSVADQVAERLSLALASNDDTASTSPFAATPASGISNGTTPPASDPAHLTWATVVAPAASSVPSAT
jgi:hypothetical protein